ncbi:MAG TPA: hypothetical protein VMT03_13205 [Polyangia bacterium]|nr:hypothetical protein [Polyangia bacterium]
MSAAKSPPPSAAQRSAPPTSGTPATSNENDEATWESLATREQKAPQLQNFKGGRVYIYLGSGALLVIVIVLLILLV